MVTFPIAKKTQLGYSAVEVDAFLQVARDQFNNPSAKVLDWRSLESKSFELVKGGYQTTAVDEALDKLQDALAAKELKAAFQWNPALRNERLIQFRGLLASRIGRKSGKRFDPVKGLAGGYSKKQVDALLNVVGEFLEGSAELSVADLRSIRFKVKRGGYSESQVDAYLAKLAEFIQTKLIG